MGERYPYSEKPLQVSFSYYRLLFMGVYIAMIIMLVVVAVVLDFQPGLGTSSILLFGAGMIVGGKFREREKRQPEKHEKRNLVISCTIIALLVSVLTVMPSLMLGGNEITQALEIVRSYGAPVYALIAVLMIGLPYLILTWSIGKGAKLGQKSEDDTF